MMCSGNTDNGMRTNFSRSSNVQGEKFFMLKHICFALMVIMMLFHSILEVLRSDVSVVSSPG